MITGSRLLRSLMLVFWIGLSVSALTLLIAAMEARSSKPCKDVNISIIAGANAMFVDKGDVRNVLDFIGGKLVGKSMKEFDLSKMEDSLESNPWVSSAELYFDNNRVLHVKVEEREPIARVFTAKGNSFYIDTTLTRLPLSEKFTPRLPVFTGFPSEKTKWKGSDSILLNQMKDISLFLAADSFWMAQIDQIDINPQKQFVMVPKVGEHTILFGDGEDAAKKFRKLYAFYDEVMSKTGWNQYSTVHVGFRGQVVGTRKDAMEIRSDTTLARQLVKQMIKSQREEALKDTIHTKTVTTTRIKEQL
ncbi:MAG: cell division protein FtsQ/DivIB [Chitinophagaceae bacterium]